MNQYLFLHMSAPDGEAFRPEDDDLADWLETVIPTGISVIGERLTEPEDARRVVKRRGEVGVTSGPFAEFTEWFAGFDLINAADIDAAVEIASRHPTARFGQIIVAPLMNPVESNELLEETVRARSAAGLGPGEFRDSERVE
ncbi:YciI family protein [Pseudolysinimonas sp.]|uniref:YciI family protein n=1 Tax=Pseudolysinimonas sp. TaxID=2680009 RepID=UPI003F7F53FD